MIELKKKDLKELAECDYVNDITYEQNANKFLGQLECVGLSYGKYGKNGAMFIGKNDGKVYVITERTSNLNRFV